MENQGVFTVKVFARHSAACPQKTNPKSKKACVCRKHLYIYEDGRVTYKSAKTRSWEQADVAAQAERGLRDPVKIKLKEIEDREAAKAAALKTATIPIRVALDRWLANQKGISERSLEAYRSSANKIARWAKRIGAENLDDITANLLDEWRGQWFKGAETKDDRMGPTTQSNFQIRLQYFFKWATRINLIGTNPAAMLDYIKPSDKRTYPLTPSQFEELLAAVEPFTKTQKGELSGFANELKALFLLQRWIGLRIQDCLKLPRSGVVGNRLRLKTQKTNADIDRILPDCVVSALNALSAERTFFRPSHFWWSKECNQKNLTVIWDRYIRKLNAQLSFVDEHGEPMKFHSHMLRDTFAVEMLLAGVSLEDVSRLLTHSSIRTTERYYAHWVKARRDQLEQKTIDAMRRMGATVTAN